MIIRFEANHRDATTDWAIQEGQNAIHEENEGPDGDEVVGDMSYEGTPGQIYREGLMDKLFAHIQE
jgi:hypothetical protein